MSVSLRLGRCGKSRILSGELDVPRPSTALTMLFLVGMLSTTALAERFDRVSGHGDILIIYRQPETPLPDDPAAEALTPAYVRKVGGKRWDAIVGDDLLKGIEAEQSVGGLVSGNDSAYPPIHFHPRYVDIPKDYQGPLIDGGLTILVAHHPCTHQLMRARVMLPSGTPTIVYSQKAITYMYEDDRVIFAFAPGGRCSIQVIRKKGVGMLENLLRLGTRVREARSQVRQKANQTPLTESVRNNARLVRDTARGTVGAALTLTSTWFDKVGQAAEALPGIKTLRSAGQQAAQGAGQIEQVRQQGLRSARETQEFVRTVR